MAYDRFLIAPLKSGLITEIKEWQIPENSFARLNNAYIYKGVVRKRFGSQLMGGTVAVQELDQLASRLRIDNDTTDGSGNITGTAPGVKFEIGQMFSIGQEIFTVVELGTPGTMITTGTAVSHTYNTTTGAYVIQDATPATKVYFYPAQPVMGLTHLEENNVETNTSYGFDTQFIYKYTGGFWERDGTVELHGDNADFINAANWIGVKQFNKAMFISNFNATIGAPAADDDPLYTRKGGVWSEFRPICVVESNLPTVYVQSARIIIPFKDRLLLLNTIERDVVAGTNSEHVNRCRFSHNGSPFPATARTPPGDPYVANDVSAAWLEPDLIWTIGGTTEKSVGAGWIDAPTEEEIVSAEYIKDRLIVYFEASVWELVWTGNKIQPFNWQKINSELGTKSLNSSIPFDKAILTVGRTGIHGCSGTNVAKINEKISDITFEIRKSSYGHERVSGVRDFFTEMAYWSFPSVNANTYSQTFPDKVLLFNYVSDSWGIADDCITAFGHYEQDTSTTWQSTELTWEEANFKWDSGSTQSQFKQVIAGNQQGFTFICDADISTNEAVIQVTNITDSGDGIAELTIINHTLNDNHYIKLIDMNGITFTDDDHNFKVSVINANTIQITAPFTGTYEGGGRAARVSRIDILSKQWNFYINKGKNFYLAKIDFAVAKTSGGEITVDYYPSATQLSMIDSGRATGSILGDNNLQTSPFDLYPLEKSQNRLWHPVYFQTEGECVQIRIYLDDEQMEDQTKSSADFQLEGLIIHTRPTSERLQ